MVDSFPIVPAHLGILWFAVPGGVGLLVGARHPRSGRRFRILSRLVAAYLAVLTYSLLSAHTARFEVSPAGLRLRGDFYGRLIPAEALRLDEARAVDLQTDPALAPRSRLVGMGTLAPGYRAGWFRLLDGERALLYVTDPKRVLYLPTTSGYVVMMSVADPGALLASLKRAAGH